LRYILGGALSKKGGALNKMGGAHNNAPRRLLARMMEGNTP
jgi:hypothetical protein